MTKKIIKIVSVLVIAVVVLGTFAACTSKPQSEQLIADWRDSTGVTGYAFHDNDSVSITYMDVTLPVLNIPFNGSIIGAYETSKVEKKDYVTIKYTVFSKSIELNFEYHVDGDILTLINSENGEKTVYTRKTEAVTPNTTASPNTSKEPSSSEVVDTTA